MEEFESYIRYLKEDVLDKEGEEIPLIIRDTKEYIQRPVIARIYKAWTEEMDKLWILDPLGRPYREEPFGIKVMKVEDEDKLVDRRYHKADIRV